MTEEFIEECKKPAYKNRLGKVEFSEGKVFTNSDNLVSIETNEKCVTNDVIMGSTNTKTITFKTLLPEELADKDFNAYIGVKYDDDTQEMLNIGKYIVESEKVGETIKNGEYKGYSYGTKLDAIYKCEIQDLVNSTIGDFYIDACRQAGLTPLKTTFDNSNILVGGNPFTNNETIRTVISNCAQAGCYFVTIDNENIDLEWFSSEVDETFTKNDYNELEKNQRFGPVNCVVIGEAAIDGSNYTEQDNVSILEYGETQISILDNYFLNTEEKRRQAMPIIWNKLNGFQYYTYKLTTSLGKPYLKVGNKLSIEDDNGIYFNTYILTNKFTYDGSFSSELSATGLSTTQQAIKNTKQTMSTAYRNVQRTVDRVNGEITDVIHTVDGQNDKISKITQTVDEINQKISDIADITTSGETSYGSLTLVGVNQSEPILVNVRPINNNISYLYPNSGLFPDSKLFSKTRILRFYNNTTKQTINYEIPDDLLYYDEEHYDEFRLDYEAQECTITKKCKYNSDGTVGLLSQQKTETYDYPLIQLEDGSYTISLLGYENGYLSVRLMASNIYTSQFATKVELNSSITQTSKNINLSVDEKLSNYSTTTQMNAAIDIKANEINQVVSKKVGNDEVISRINQTPESITINANKLNLNGYVTVSDLSTSGKTTINGSNITTGTIDALKVNVTNVVAKSVAAENITGTTISGKTISGGTITGTTVNTNNGKIAGWDLSTDGFTNGTVFIRKNGYSNIYTAADLFILRAIILGEQWAGVNPGTEEFRRYDLNGDGVINSQDYYLLRQLILGNI